MNINKIIKEEIQSYLSNVIMENGYFETKTEHKNTKDEDEDQSKNGTKKHGFDQYQQELEDLHDNGELNYRQLAANMYGLSTSTKSKAETSKLNSKASALRKKIKGEEAASGGHFHLTAKDASNIAQELSK